jgi:hypothetical protein
MGRTPRVAFQLAADLQQIEAGVALGRLGPGDAEPARPVGSGHGVRLGNVENH